MLVLSRRTGESICFAIDTQTITVEVIEVRGHRVRLGILAPTDVAIVRGELQLMADLLADIDPSLDNG